jgi:hypothetical protein
MLKADNTGLVLPCRWLRAIDSIMTDSISTINPKMHELKKSMGRFHFSGCLLAETLS